MGKALGQSYSEAFPQRSFESFNPDQYAAFQNIRDIQGISDPYFAASRNYLQQGAAPVSEAEISQYLNPNFNFQLAALNDTLGAQNNILNNQYVTQAGGDASRVGVANAEKFRQDQLARGQLAANTYGAALAAAQQDKQRQEAAAALAMTQGQGALQGKLGETGALYNMGSQQQQFGQLSRDALFQWLAGKYQDPFMRAQAAAGITQGLAPGLGGTEVTTYPEQSPWGQILGLGMMGAGAFMNPTGFAAGMGGNLMKSVMSPTQSQQAGTSGWWKPYQFGGEVRDGDLPPDFGQGPPAYIQPTFPPRDPNEIVDLTDINFGSGIPVEHTNPALAADAGYSNPFADPILKLAGQPGTVGGIPRPVLGYAGPADDAPSGDPGIPAAAPRGPGLPPMPQYPGLPPRQGPDVNPWANFLMNAGAAMAAAPGRDARGLPLGGGPVGQFARAAGLGLQGGFEALQKRRQQEMAENRQAMDAERLLEESRFRRLPYLEMTAQQRAQETREQNRLRSERMKPFDYMELSDGTKVKGLYDKNWNLKLIEPNTGKWIDPGDFKPPADMIAGMSKDALRMNAERYVDNGSLPPNLGRGTQGDRLKKAILNEAAEIAKERGVDFTQLPNMWRENRATQVAMNRFFSGVQGNTMRALNVVVDHTATLRDLGDALKNGNIQRFNQIAQRWGEETGNPAPTNFDTAKRIVGAEIVKALGVAGAGTEAERKEYGDSFNRARSPDQLNGAIVTVQKLLAGQLSGMRKQFVGATHLGEEKFNDMLLPETRSVLESLERGQALTGGGLSDQDKQALDWANKNPKDPRAKEIKKRLGVQ